MPPELMTLAETSPLIMFASWVIWRLLAQNDRLISALIERTDKAPE